MGVGCLIGAWPSPGRGGGGEGATQRACLAAAACRPAQLVLNALPCGAANACPHAVLCVTPAP